MPQLDETLQTIDLLYRAAMEPEIWPEALEKFAYSVGCIGMAMIPITPHDTTGLVVSPAMRDVEVDYNKGWSEYDSRVRRIFSRHLSRGVFCEAQLFKDEELQRDPFRQEFCRSWGIGAFAAQLVEPWPGHVVAFSAQRGLRRGHFEADEIERLRYLGQHAVRALTISVQMAARKQIADRLLDILERFDGGVLVLDGRGEVVMMNVSAERMLGDGLTVTKRRVFASTFESQQALDLLIGSALDEDGVTREPGPLALPRPSGKKALLARTMPLRSRAIDELETLAFVPDGLLLLVVDPEGSEATPQEILRVLGLTSAEARLASLVGSGMRRRDAAAVLGITEWTARDALKHVYSKLDITSQGELVRLVGRIAPVGRKRSADI